MSDEVRIICKCGNVHTPADPPKFHEEEPRLYCDECGNLLVRFDHL